MLRFIVLALVFINAAYYAWSHGLLQAYGLAPVSQSEPQRLAQQIRPDALRVLSVPELSQADAATRTAARPPLCLQAGLFDEAQSAQLSRTLESTLPAGAWLLDTAIESARWIVYMGKYANAAELAKKRSELASLNLQFEPLINPELELGLSLGGFETQAQANVALAALSRRGVRTARVLQERAEQRGSLLRLPAVDDTLRSRLDDLKPALAGKLLSPCR
jgi:hypothetical protein